MTYLQQMKDDILEWIREEGTVVTEDNRDKVEEELNDRLWVEDSVTGNGSGSYTFNSMKAREYVLEDGEDYVAELIEDFCLDGETVARHLFDWEYWDVSIRCWLLGQAIAAALDELLEEDDDGE